MNSDMLSNPEAEFAPPVAAERKRRRSTVSRTSQGSTVSDPPKTPPPPEGRRRRSFRNASKASSSNASDTARDAPRRRTSISSKQSLASSLGELPLPHSVSRLRRRPSLASRMSGTSSLADADYQARRTELRKSMHSRGSLAVTPDDPASKLWRWRLVWASHTLLESNVYKVLTSLVILTHTGFGVVETDLTASDAELPKWMMATQWVFLVFYINDILMRMMVAGKQFLHDSWNIFDLTIVVIDIGMALFQSRGPISATLRCLRMMRTIRVLRSFLMFRELYVMMAGLTSSIRPILFGIVLMFFVLTVWSILAVELLHPLNKELADEGIYEDCERCPRAFASVMTSNLTFLQGIVAGDSWGQVAVPLMEKSSTAAVILLFCLLSIELGLLNIITAVIVDKQAETRLNDEELISTIKREQLKFSYVRLLDLFATMDENDNGMLSIDELEAAYFSNEEFQEMLNRMDVTEDNLQLLFEIMDKDQSGQVSYSEFVERLHYMKSFDSHTLMIFTTHNVERLRDMINKQLELMGRLLRFVRDTGREVTNKSQEGANQLGVRLVETSVDRSVCDNVQAPIWEGGRIIEQQLSGQAAQTQKAFDEHLQTLLSEVSPLEAEAATRMKDQFGLRSDKLEGWTPSRQAAEGRIAMGSAFDTPCSMYVCRSDDCADVHGNDPLPCDSPLDAAAGHYWAIPLEVDAPVLPPGADCVNHVQEWTVKQATALSRRQLLC